MFSIGATSAGCLVSSGGRRMSLSSAWLGSSNSAIRQFRFPDSAAFGAKLRHYAWKDKTEYFGIDLKTDVILESDKVGPSTKIKGQLVIDTKFPIEHDGIFVQLEAVCSLNYSTKFNERTSMHKGEACILENTKVNTFGHLESPIKCEIIPITPPEFGGHSINSGVWNYPFQLQIPCDPRLPAPFQNSHGNLDYRLVVYMISHSSATYVKLSEKTMLCEGHYNLMDDWEESQRPIVVEQYYRKSYFSQKKQVKATLTVRTSGFLQEETVPFSLTVKNTKALPLRLSVNLLQHIKYQATTNLASVVKVVTTIASAERDEVEDPKPEIQWTGSIRFPETLPPTYSCNTMYNVTYMLEFQVRSIEEEVIVTGQARILLGTMRQLVESQDRSSEDTSVAPQPGDLIRSGSESSIHSQRSIYSAPMAYSVPANLNLSLEESDDEREDDGESEPQPGSSASCMARMTSPSNRQQRSHSHHDISESLPEDGEMETGRQPMSAPYTTASVNSLLSNQTTLTLPPSYSQLSSRIPSTETLPPTYADLDLSVESSESLMFGDAEDLEKRYSINLDSLNLEDEYQVTFYSV